MWRDRFKRYVLHPHSEWPRGRTRQADKLEQRVEAAGSPDYLSRQVVALAEKRRLKRPPTLFVVNCGSSGSHWLTTMLSEIPGIADCGEVYVPPAMLSEARGWSAADRGMLIDCIHLVHAPVLSRDLADHILINSAHKSGWAIANALGTPCVRALLIRDPLDIVMSRTFRKPELRSEIAVSASDAAYLDRNIEFVQEFYLMAENHLHDIIVRYEHMRKDAASVIGGICETLRIGVSTADVERATKVDSSRTNKYRGAPIDIPRALVERAAERLRSLREQLGYV